MISVTAYDNSDNPTVEPLGNYYVDTIREPGRIALRAGAVWAIPLRLTDGIVIQYVVGCVNDGTSVPEAIKTTLHQIVSHWYEHRGEAATPATSRGTTIILQIPVPLVIQALLDPYRVRYSGV